jgi:type II secretory pathway pseudopilin PulG
MRRARTQGGFAMLFIFVMAGIVAITFYMQLPRVAFENQRNKEELLIERGEQYTRAIQLFFRQQKKYPNSIDDLEQFNGKRYLRRRYADPMTGKSEWRIIKIGPGGVFENSLTRKPPGAEGKDGKDAKKESVNTFTYEAPVIGAAGQAGQQGPSAVPQLRPSEQRAAAASGSGPLPPGMAGQLPPGGVAYGGQPGQPGPPQGYGPAVAGQQNPYSPTMAGQFPGQTGAVPAGYPPQPGQPGYGGQPVQGQPGMLPFPNAQPNAQSGASGNTQQQSSFVGGGQFIGSSSAPPQPGQAQPGRYPNPNQAGNPQGAQPFPYSQQSGVQGAPSSFPTPPGGLGQGAGAGQPGPAGANPAADMIWKSLTTPRTPPNVAGAQQPGTQVGGGIAGVASMMEKSGIKLYNEHDKYNEWEFIYDFSQDKSGQKNQAGINGATSPGQPAGSPAGSPASPSGFGSNSGSSGFGSSGFGSPGFGSQGSGGFGQSPGAPLGVRSR